MQTCESVHRKRGVKKRNSPVQTITVNSSSFLLTALNQRLCCGGDLQYSWEASRRTPPSWTPHCAFWACHGRCGNLKDRNLFSNHIFFKLSWILWLQLKHFLALVITFYITILKFEWQQKIEMVTPWLSCLGPHHLCSAATAVDFHGPPCLCVGWGWVGQSGI